MGRKCSTDRIDGKCLQSLVRKAEGKRPFGGARRGWEGNIKMDRG